MKVALYVRVSTHDQHCELQLRELKAHAEHEEWQIIEVYEDVVSGTKARRPGLDRLMADANAKTFDCVFVGSLTGSGVLW
jgi:DNA invertase Pin-like site-specific DNA recombinase